MQKWCLKGALAKPAVETSVWAQLLQQCMTGKSGTSELGRWDENLSFAPQWLGNLG